MKDINESKDYFLLSRELSYEVERAIYKRSYYEFYKKAFKVLNPDEPFSDNWHLKYLCDRLQEELYRVARRLPREKDIIINVPFRSSKSLIVSVIFPVWAWTIKASTKFICVSFSSDLSLELATLSRNLIESEWIKDLYGSSMELVRDENTKGFFKNKGGGFRKSVGTGGQITGSGADFILCLPEGQIIVTSEGPKDVKDIVENKLDVQILSYNHKSNEVEYKNIVRYDKNQGRKLIKITLESGKEIICTEDHEIWTEENGYIKAKDIQLSNTLLVNDR